MINRDYLNKIKKLSLKQVLKSFAIGVSLHMIYGTIIISLKIFNFYTILLPIIICDICLIIYIYYKKSTPISEYFSIFNKKNIRLFIKEKGSYILILLTVFLLLFIIQMYFINISLAYPGNDVYFWFNNIWYVNKYGFLDYNNIKSYPPGFVIFCSSISIFINDYPFFYFFLKYIPLFFSIINILVLYVISKGFFKKKINIFFTLMMYLGFTVIFNRNNKAIPSLLVTSLGFLFLLFLGKGTSRDIDLKIPSLKKFLIPNIKNKNIILKGILFAGMGLAHPLYIFFFMLFYFSYEFFLFLLMRLKTQSLSYKLKLILLRNFLLTQLIICLIFVILVSPYIIGTSINREAFILGSYYSYVSDPGNVHSLSLNILSLGTIFRDLGEWILSESLYNSINQFFAFILAGSHVYTFYKTTIQVGIFLIFYGIFLKFKKSHKLNEKQNMLVNFFKFTFIFTLLIFYLSQFFVYFFNIPLISNIVNLFYQVLRLRLFELFSGYWAILFVLAFNHIVIRIKEKYVKARRKKFSIKRISRFSKISIFSVIIFTSGFFYLINIATSNYSMYFNEEQVQAVTFIGNYFEENPLEAKENILLEEFEFNAIYGLIVDENLEKNYYNFTYKTNYLEFNDDFNLLNCEFIFLNISKLNENFKANFSLNFEIIYNGNNGFIFSKFK